MKINGILRPGYQVASGTSKRDTRFYPHGTIKLQAPFFAAAGLDLEQHFGGKLFWGTLNIDIFPQQYEHSKHDFFFQNIHWTPLQPAENFFMSHATLTVNGVPYKALVYTPDPSTKPNHFEPPTLIEFIAEWIPGLNYGDQIEITVDEDHIKLSPFKGEHPPILKDTAQ